MRTAGIDGRPLHVETGYLRPAGRVELVVVQPTGIVEGSLDTGDGIALRLRFPQRRFDLHRQGRHRYRTGPHSRRRRAGHPPGYGRRRLPAHHLASELHRAEPTSEKEIQR